MDRIIKAGGWAATLVVAGMWLGWTDGFHVIGAACLLVLLALVRLVWHRWRSSGEGAFAASEPLPDSPARSLVLGVAGGGVCVLVLAASFSGLERIPWLYGGYQDRDREPFEARLATLEGAGNFEEAAALARARLEQPLSPAWRERLAGRLVRDLVAAGNRSPSLETASRHFAEARAVAEEHGLDGQLAQFLLTHTEREGGLAGGCRSFVTSRNGPSLWPTSGRH